MAFADDLIIGLDAAMAIAGIDATYRPKAGGALPIRFLSKQEFDREVIIAGSKETAEAIIQASDLSDKPVYGDLIEVDGDVWKVMRIIETTKAGWRVELQANAVPNLAGGARYD